MEAVGRLTGGIAHDFNNLLMAVLGSLSSCARGCRTSRGRAAARQRHSGAQRGASLTQRMLAFARRQDLKPTAVDLPTWSAACGAAAALHRADVRSRSASRTTCRAHRVDPNQLELSLLNLAVNARDAMPEAARLQLHRVARRTASRGGRPRAQRPLHLPVGDRHGGRDGLATIAKAIEPFFSTKGVGKGTGLGLSMVHGLVEQSGKGGW